MCVEIVDKMPLGAVLHIPTNVSLLCFFEGMVRDFELITLSSLSGTNTIDSMCFETEFYVISSSEDSSIFNAS